MQAPALRYGDHSSHVKAESGFTHSKSDRKLKEDSDLEGPQHFSKPLSVVIMPQSPRPNLSVSTEGLVSMPRPRGENASLNSHPQGLMSGRQTLSHFEMARLERDRKDWRELAAFLRTNDPPKSNFMSNIDEENGGKGRRHAAPLQMFRRSAAKKSSSKSTKPLQLPDSAVAARTSKGHWHIAISIPLSAISTFADDIQQVTSPQSRVVEEEERPLSSQPPSYRPSSAQAVRSGSISSRVSQNSIHPALRKEQSTPVLSNNRNSNELLNGDAGNTMESYYRQERLENEDNALRSGHQSLDQILSSSKRSSQTSVTSPNGTSPLIKRGTFGAVYINDIERNNNQLTRHSGGTVYGENNLETASHNRMNSGGSTNGQMPTNIELPRRSSSRPKDGTAEATSPITPSKSDRRRQEGHMNTGSGDSASSAAMIEATEGLQHQLASSMRNAPRTPAPTRALPDLPEVSDDGCACPNHHHSRSISEGGKQCQSPASRPSPKKLFQERQEKVKALRRRDIEAMKAKETSRRRSTHPPVTHVKMICALGCQHAKSQSESPPSLPMKSSNRSARHVARPAAFNTNVDATDDGIGLSPIRTIASTSPTGVQLSGIYSCATPTSTSQSLPDDFLDSLLPSYDYHRLSSAANRHSNISTSATNNTMMDGRKGSRSGRSNRSDGDRTIRTLTPPRSLSPSFASSDEDGVHLASPHSLNTSRRQSAQTTIPHIPSNTSTKRISRSSFHRRMESKESTEDVKEIKERMKRLERDNERILKTLNAMMGMQQGVKDLCELFAPSRPSTATTGAIQATLKGMERELTEGEKAVRRVNRTLEQKPLSLRGSPRSSGSGRASTYGDEDIAQRMRSLEADMARLGHSGLEIESGRTLKTGCDALRPVSTNGWEELSVVEPLMREVRMNARVSHESRRECTDEEELGYGLMEQGC